MKFLIQSENGKIIHDFAFTLTRHIESYNEWLTEREENSLIRFRITDKKLFGNYIPVGSVEFVSNYLTEYYNLTPKPINIPDSLNKKEFLERDVCVNNLLDTIFTHKKPLFIKSNTKIKAYTGLVNFKKPLPDFDIPNDTYLCSEVIEIESEWRGFVHKGVLLDIKNYSGDPFIFPNINTINKMISEYKDDPVAYTIDVAINSGTGNTVLIECHDFFSCGLYGFNHHKYPWMLSQWFYEFIRKNWKK